MSAEALNPRVSSLRRERSPALPWAAWWAAVAMVLGATLVRGGNRGVALVGLEWLALVVLGTWLARLWPGPGSLLDRGADRWALVLLLAAPLWVAALQLMPWPGIGPLSTTPSATAYAALAGLPIVACLVLGLAAPGAQLETLLRLWLGVALAQAALGLVQLGHFEALNFGLQPPEWVRGTYASKNTYANLLVMALPLALWALFESSRSERRESARRPWLWVVGVFVLLSAVLASTSRGGIATGLLALLLSLALLQPRARSEARGRQPRYRLWTLGAAAVVLLLALLAGGLDWVERFDASRLAADNAMRGLNRASAWQGTLAFWPAGSGLGSFAGVFPRFQAPELGAYLVDLAHSDYLQLFMECGAAGVALVLAAVWLVVRRGLQLWRAGMGPGWGRAERLAMACGIGALATALHAWVDYPFHIPANAMLMAFLLGVYLRSPQGGRGR